MARTIIPRDIFLSYRRCDAESMAQQTAKILGEYGHRVFLDTARIRTAEKFPDRIRVALDKAEFVITLIGESWLDARDRAGNRRLQNPKDFVRREIKYALDLSSKGRPQILPVLLGDCQMPDSAELPREISGLTEFVAYQVNTENLDAEVRDLERELDRIERRARGKSRALGRDPRPIRFLGSTSIAELEDVPVHSAWELQVSNGLGLRFETREQWFFEGELVQPRRIGIEGKWNRFEVADGTLHLVLRGATFDGEEFNITVPIQRKFGFGRYNGRNARGDYFRLVCLRVSGDHLDGCL